MPVRGFSRKQAYLLRPSLDDWLPGDHPVRYVAEFVDALEAVDWQEMGIDLEGAETGAPAYHPRVLISVWLAGFMSGIWSSRKLEGACRDQRGPHWPPVPSGDRRWSCPQTRRRTSPTTSDTLSMTPRRIPTPVPRARS